MEAESVSCWINQLKEGNQHAARRLWERYGGALQRLAKSRYRGVLNAVFDEQDLAQSVFVALWKNAEEGRLEEIQDRTELWWLLLEITRRRALSRLEFNRAQKRGANITPDVSNSSDDSAIDIFSQLSDLRELPPEMVVILSDEHDRFMSLLPDDMLRNIASQKLEGYSVSEIAVRLNLSTRTVIRKLNLIREHWVHEMGASY